jgi:hypothetical protein
MTQADAVGGNTGVATASQCGGSVPDGVGRPRASRRKVPASQPERARGTDRHGVSRPHGTTGISVATAETTTSSDCRRCRKAEIACLQKTKRNLRGKRQDPWRKANDPALAGCRPCGQRSDCGNNLQPRPDPVRSTCVGRRAGDLAQKLHPTSRRDGVTPAVAGSAAEPERPAKSVQTNAASGNWQPCDTRRVEQSAKCQ